MGFRLTHYAIWTGLVLAAGSCCFSPVFAGTPPVEIRDSIPLHEAGIGNNVRVARNTSFAVLIVAAHGVDLTDPDNIRFVVDDEVHRPYVRDLGDDTVRVIKLNDDKDRRATQFWLVYDRALETYMPDSYGIDAIVMISVTIRDIYNNYFPPSVFEFKIESEAEYAAALQNMPETVALDPSDPILEGVYDTGIEVVSGDLTGAKIIYASSEPLAPMFGPLDEIAPLDAAGLEIIGVPINLQPHTVFNVPVRIFIPNPAQADLSEIGIYYYNGLRWQLAWDADAGGLDAGFGWVPAESGVRISDDDPAQIVMDAHHFSGIQAVAFTRFKSSEDDKKDHTASGATVFVSCFIDAAGAGNLPDVWIFAVIGLLLAGFAGSRLKKKRQF